MKIFNIGIDVILNLSKVNFIYITARNTNLNHLNLIIKLQVFIMKIL